MDSSSVQQDVHLENRSSSGAPSTSEELLDCKNKSDLPVTADEINSKLCHMYQITSSLIYSHMFCCSADAERCFFP